MDDNSFSVWIFFPDESYTPEARFIDGESAVRLAKDITLRPAALIGIIARVIITDGGDFTVFEWTHDRGVVFPKTNP